MERAKQLNLSVASPEADQQRLVIIPAAKDVMQKGKESEAGELEQNLLNRPLIRSLLFGKIKRGAQQPMIAGAGLGLSIANVEAMGF